jgi:transposase
MTAEIARIVGIDIGIPPKPFITTSDNDEFEYPLPKDWQSKYEEYADFLLSNYHVIGLENLSQGINPWISSIGYPLFKQILLQKNKAYRRLIFGPAWSFPSSKLCSSCNKYNKDLKSSDNEWACPTCGATHQRDLNAAINLRNYATQAYAEWYKTKFWYHHKYGWQIIEKGNFGQSKPATWPIPLSLR